MPDARVIQGQFGGTRAIDAPSDSPHASAAPSSAAGDPITPGTAQKQLELVAHNARIGATRLIQVPVAGSIPKNVLEPLLQTYVTIQGNLADIASRAGSADVQKDLMEVQQQTSAFIDGVEAAITAAQPPTSAAPSALAPLKREIPWMLIGAGGLGLLAIGIGVYQYQKAQVGASTRAARAARSRKAAFAGLAGTTSRRKGRRKGRKRSYAEE